MSGAGGMEMGLPGGPDGMTRFPGQNRGQLVGGPFDKPIFGGGGPQMRLPVERGSFDPEPIRGGGNPIDQPIPFPMMREDFSLPDPGFGYSDPMPDPGFGGGKGGQIDQPIGIDPAPIQGGGGGSGSNGPGLDHLKDYGPVVDQMKQYVQSMSGLIDQINSKF